MGRPRQRFTRFNGVFSLLCLLGFFPMFSKVCADETPPAGIDGLIEALASTNSPPRVAGESGHLEAVPEGYDHAVQDRVWQAREKLLSKGAAAFPQLTAHVGDKRYSMTYADDDEAVRHDRGYRNVTVGHVCSDIIFAQVYASFPVGTSRDHIGPGRPYGYWVFDPRDPAAAAKWWQDHKDKTLAALQREVLQGAVDRERKRGFSDLGEEAQVIGPLLYLLIKIDQSGNPLPPDQFRPVKRL